MMRNASPIAVHHAPPGAFEHFSTHSVPAHQRHAYWGDLVAQTFPRMTVDAPEGIRAELSRWTLGRVEIACAQSQRARVARKAADTAEPHLVLHLQRHGRMAFTQAGRTVSIGTGGAFLAEDDEAYAIEISDRNDCMILDLPVTMLGDDIARRDWHGVTLNQGDPNLTLLSRMIESLWRERAWHDAIDDTMDEVLAAMIRIACLRGTPAPLPSAPAGTGPVSFALAQLADPDLTTGAIATATGLSTRAVQKIFLREVGQSPSGFITRQRLARAAAMLEQGRGQTVTDIAYDVGFSDSAFFSRCFRRYYGVAPREWRAARAAGTALPQRLS